MAYLMLVGGFAGVFVPYTERLATVVPTSLLLPIQIAERLTCLVVLFLGIRMLPVEGDYKLGLIWLTISLGLLIVLGYSFPLRDRVEWPWLLPK